MSKKKRRHKRPPGGQPAPSVTLHGSVLRSIRQHARQSPNAEICGVLIGRRGDGVTTVTGSIPGEETAQGRTHVTFTQETWVKIHEEKDRKYSGQPIVGWYHSHPGFGVFLSDHDLFIHKNFFAEPGSLAWVYDPHSDEEACFGWNEGKVHRLERYGVVSETTGDAAPRPEPAVLMDEPVPQQATPRPGPALLWWWPALLRTLIYVAAAILLALLVRLGQRALQQGFPPARPRHDRQPGRVQPATVQDADAPAAQPAERGGTEPAGPPAAGDRGGEPIQSDRANDSNGGSDER